MTADRWIGAIALVVCIVYGYAAFNYQLMPFERHMVFKPNTLPLVLSALGSIIAITLMIGGSPKPESSTESTSSTDIDWRKLRQYKVGQAVAILGAMAAYAILLRPIGFLAATVLFLAGGALILGERKLHILLPVAVTGALVVWLLVQELLGIYMRPFPALVSP